VSAIVAPAQTASELTARYGDPDVERFLVCPGITLMARYAGDRTACEMVIGPIRSIIAYSDDVDGRFQRDVNGHSGHVNKVGAQRRWDYNHARYLRG
jgi:hypothetical protein